MKKSGYMEEQIAFALKQAEAGTPAAEVIRRIAVSEQTFFQWKKVYGGLAPASCGGRSSLRTRTASSSSWSLT